KKSLAEKENELRKINNDLVSLNQQKEDLLSYLRDTDSFKRFKLYQKDLVKIESELLQLREKLTTIDRILEKERDRERLHKEIEHAVTELRELFQHTEDNVRYSDIRTKFTKFFKSIMDETARLSWKINN